MPRKYYDRKSISFIFNTVSLSILLISLGILLYYFFYSNLLDVSKALSQNIDESTRLSLTNKQIFYELGKLISGVLLSTGGLSLLLEISTIKKFIVGAISDFTKSAYFDLSNYNVDDLNSLQKRIVLAKNKHKSLTVNSINNSVYVLEEELNKLLMGLYYEYHDMTTIIIPDMTKSLFNKKVSIEYKIVNLFEIKNSIQFQISLIKGTSITTKGEFNVKKFQVNDTIFKKEEIESFTYLEEIKDETSNFSHKIIFKRDFDICKEHTIYIEYEYNIPIDDLTHSFKLPLPSKKINHSIILSGEEAPKWSLFVNGFASWFHHKSNFKREFQTTHSTPTNCDIRFNYWSLPGAGYVVSLKNKV